MLEQAEVEPAVGLAIADDVALGCGRGRLEVRQPDVRDL
jgi:hypothetical protein